MPRYDTPLSPPSGDDEMESEPLVSGREERAQALLDAIEAGDAAAVADALDACTGMGGMAEED